MAPRPIPGNIQKAIILISANPRNVLKRACVSRSVTVGTGSWFRSSICNPFSLNAGHFVIERLVIFQKSLINKKNTYNYLFGFNRGVKKCFSFPFLSYSCYFLMSKLLLKRNPYENLPITSSYSFLHADHNFKWTGRKLKNNELNR